MNNIRTLHNYPDTLTQTHSGTTGRGGSRVRGGADLRIRRVEYNIKMYGEFYSIYYLVLIVKNS